MVFGGGITVYILEFLVENSSTSSGNFARDRALEEKKSKGFVKTEGERNLETRKKGKVSNMIEATEGWLSAALQGEVLKTVFLNVLPY